MSEQTPPKRFRAGDVIENLQRTIEALTTRATVGSASFEAVRNAKGEVQIAEAKISAPLGCDLEALAAHAEQVRLIAQANFDAMAAWHPAGSGYVVNDKLADPEKTARKAAAIARSAS